VISFKTMSLSSFGTFRRQKLFFFTSVTNIFKELNIFIFLHLWHTERREPFIWRGAEFMICCVLFVMWCAACWRLSSSSQAWLLKTRWQFVFFLYSSLLVSLTCSFSLKHTHTHSHTHWLLYWVWGHTAFKHRSIFISFSPFMSFPHLFYYSSGSFHSLKSAFLDMWNIFFFSLHYHVLVYHQFSLSNKIDSLT